MSLTMYDASVPVIARILGNLSAILDKAIHHCEQRKIDPSVLLQWRLAPDMFHFTRQVQISADFAKGMGARLAGIDIPKFDDTETSFEELKGRIKKTLDFLASLKKEQFTNAETREINLEIRGNKLQFSGKDYLFMYVLPNFYFHVTTAYDILRHCGVEIGKMDFIGAPPR